MNKDSIDLKSFVFDELRDARRALAITKTTEAKQRTVADYNSRIRTNETTMEWCDCLCGNATRFDLIATIDRNGFDQQTVSCRDCGLIFCNPRMTPAEAAYFYQSDYYRRSYDGDNYLENLSKNYGSQSPREILSVIDTCRKISPDISIVEIGAGGGWNLLPFAERGAQVTGIEYSPSLAEMGRARGLNIINGGADSLTGHYDIIIINHVLEHMHNPVAVLAMLKEHLRPGGIIYVGVPNIMNFDLSQFQNAHLYYFAPKNFQYYCAKAGLQTLRHGAVHGIHMYAILGAGPPSASMKAPSLGPCANEVYGLLRTLRLRRKFGRLLRRLGLKR